MLGSQNAGLYAFTILQSVGTAFAFASACCYLEKLEIPRAVRFALLVVCSVLPLYPAYATTMMKDSFHAMFFVVYLVVVIEAVRSKGEVLRSWKYVVMYVVIAGLCILTKKTGIYIVGLTSAVLVIAYFRGNVARATTVLLAPILLCCMLIPAVVYPLIGGVAPGGRQEMLGALFQQTMTAVLSDPDGIAREDLDAIDSVFDLEKAKKRYSKADVDKVKNTYRKKSKISDLARFGIAYLRIGLTHPVEYAKSIGRIALPFMAPVSHYSYFTHFQKVFDSGDHYWEKVKEMEGDPGFSFSKPSQFRDADQAIRGWMRHVAESFPVLGWVFSMGLYSGWLPITSFFTAMFYSRREILAHVPLIVAFAFILLSPVSSPRYVVPFLYAVPLMVGLICWAMIDWQEHRRFEIESGVNLA